MSSYFTRTARVEVMDLSPDFGWRSLTVIVVALIVLGPLAPYRLELGPLHVNLDRLVMIPALILIIVRVLATGRTFLLPWLTFLGLLVSIGITLFSPNVDVNLLAVYAPNAIYGYTVYLVIHLYTARGADAQQTVLTALAVAGLAYIVFSIYSIHHLYVLREPLYDLPFREQLPFPIAEPSGATHLAKIGLRIALPFGTPQTLATVTSALGLLFVMQGRRWLSILAILMFGISLATISRTGIYSVVAALAVMSTGAIIFRPKEMGWLIYRLRWIVFSVIVSLVVVTIFVDDKMYSSFDRLFSVLNQSDQYGHVYIRQVALDAWADGNLVEKFFGIGYGGFENAGEAFRAHMSSLTILVERGLVGLLLAYWIIVALPVAFMIRYLGNVGNPRDNLIGLMVSSQIFFANIFYELYDKPIMWTLIGLLAGMAWPSRRTAQPLLQPASA